MTIQDDIEVLKAAQLLARKEALAAKAIWLRKEAEDQAIEQEIQMKNIELSEEA
jgi:hypothetical protein